MAQTAAGKVLWHFTMSRDGFIAGPNHGMDWMTGFTVHVAPVLLGDGIRLFDNPAGTPVRLELLNGGSGSVAVNLRYRPVATK